MFEGFFSDPQQMTVATSTAARTRHGRRELMDRTALLIGRKHRPSCRYNAPRAGVKIAGRAVLAFVLACTLPAAVGLEAAHATLPLDLNHPEFPDLRS